jgi:hypothetical protein
MLLYCRGIFIGILVSACLLTHTTFAYAQQADSVLVADNEPPDAPTPQMPGQSDPGSISGTVKDNSGAVITGAGITLEVIASAGNWRMESNGAGEFNFSAVDPGIYRVTVAAKGFASWTSAPITVHGGEKVALPPIVLQVASASSSVSVGISQHDIAEEQIHEEEKQRLAGIFPEFHVSYKWNAAPLSAGQKFKLAWKGSTDPVTLTFTGVVAGIEQALNYPREYGQGTEGFAKRYGANYADEFGTTMIGSAILPSIFHQDPRYFIKGTGSKKSRALHAMEFPFVCRGDNGRLMPNYSFMLGAYASAELSNTYYPPRMQTDTGGVSMLEGYAGSAVSNLITEFVLPHITKGAPRKVSPNAQLVLREGTPVSLILTDDLSAEDARRGKTVAFALVGNIKVDGVVVAKAGSKASGEVIGAAKSSTDGKAEELPLQFLSLQVGEEKVPLRGSKGRAGDDGFFYRLPGSVVVVVDTGKKIQIPAGAEFTAYVAADISLHPAQ